MKRTDIWEWLIKRCSAQMLISGCFVRGGDLSAFPPQSEMEPFSWMLKPGEWSAGQDCLWVTEGSWGGIGCSWWVQVCIQSWFMELFCAGAGISAAPADPIPCNGVGIAHKLRPTRETSRWDLSGGAHANGILCFPSVFQEGFTKINELDLAAALHSGKIVILILQMRTAV